MTAQFRSGKNIAVSTKTDDGSPAENDGFGATFSIAAPDPARARGMLRNVGRHHLQFAGNQRYFIKAGADSPENFLGYADFDNTQDHPQQVRPGEAVTEKLFIHRYEPHIQDWNPGDPTWKDGKGKGMIGALNYLASKGMNSVYFLTMNVNGDGREVYPWTTYNQDFTRFDCSKLDQWEIVFSHMDKLDLQLHVLLQETENDKLLNNGDLGLERKLYYREMIARFGHHLALEWNLGEETKRSPDQHKADAEYIKLIDPYQHPVVVHTYPGQYDKVYQPLLGFKPLNGPSLQMGNMNQTFSETLTWVTRSRQAGHPWIVCLDEIGGADTGVKPDKDDPDHDQVRKQALWGNLMAGGGGVEWYFGYKFAHNDLNCEDWRSRDRMWDQTRHAIDFFHKHLPFWEMQNQSALVEKSAWCFARPGEVYAVYLLDGGTTTLDLGDANATFTVRWYNPRTGGELQPGSVQKITGPGKHSLGQPPSDGNRDWAILIKRQ